MHAETRTQVTEARKPYLYHWVTSLGAKIKHSINSYDKYISRWIYHKTKTHCLYLIIRLKIPFQHVFCLKNINVCKSITFFFWIWGNLISRKAHFVGPSEPVKSRLFQTLIKDAHPDSNSRPAQISSPLIYFYFMCLKMKSIFFFNITFILKIF